MFNYPLAIIDTETTGMTATVDRITEVAILRVIDGKLVEEWSSLVNPECSIPMEIQLLTGITNAMARAAPKFYEIAEEVHRRLHDHVFVAHNARFDYGFIKNEFRRLNMPFTAEVLCTVRLSRRLYPNATSHSLDALRDRHRLTSAGRHRALGDARAAWQFIEIVAQSHAPEVLTLAAKVLMKMPSLPPQLPIGALDNLPEGPGVYTFYGVSNTPIYIGKAKDIRSRVRSHFSSDHRSANDQRLSVEIMRIDYEETCGEMGALLREAVLIKTLMPLRNHKLRRNRDLAFIRLRNLAEPVEIIKVEDVDFAQTAGLYGPFSTKARAKSVLASAATEHHLCLSAMSSKKLSGPCFSYQLKKCAGFCAGQESLFAHNLRMIAALAEYKFQDWRADGLIAIKEIHAEHKWERVHVFNHWLYHGSARDETELGELLAAKNVIEFDADIYKILCKYLQRNLPYQIFRSSALSECEARAQSEITANHV
jgi:DNA polymerase III subunit epsilon